MDSEITLAGVLLLADIHKKAGNRLRSNKPSTGSAWSGQFPVDAPFTCDRLQKQGYILIHSRYLISLTEKGWNI